MPLGLPQTTNLTLNVIVSDSFTTTIGKASTLDGNHAIAGAINQTAIIRLTDVPADFHEATSIKVRLDDVRFVNAAGSKTNASTIRTILRNSNSTAFYTEDISALVNRTLFLEGTERTTSDGSNPWTSSELNDLELSLEVTAAVPDIGSGVNIDFAYIELKYKTTPPPTYNSSLSRPIMQQGTTILSGGTIIID